MMKIVLFGLLVLVAVAQAGKKVCETRSGKKLVTFGDSQEVLKFPCKYNAIRDTRCGNFRIVVTPGNMLENDRNKLYVIKTMYISIERLSDNLKWEGRTDIKVARKYLDGVSEFPFNTKDGGLDITKVVTFSSPSADPEVSMTAKNGDFKLSFSLYDPSGRWHKNSRFSFHCYSDTFEPTDYPEQLCGNGTRKEVRTFRKAMEWKDNRQATLFYNLFTNTRIAQTDNICAAAQKAMSKQCTYNGQDLRYKAANLCWPILGRPGLQRCISRNLDSPISAFRHCVEFVCSGYTDMDACTALGDELDLCPKLKEIFETVRDTCKPDILTP